MLLQEVHLSSSHALVQKSNMHHRYIMRRWAIAALCALLAVAACRQAQLPLPVPEDTLIEMLCDIHIAEGVLQEKVIEQQDSLGRLFYDNIYRIHGVAEADFQAAMILLRKDAKRLNALYGKVIEQLTIQDAVTGQNPSLEADTSALRSAN